MKNVKIISLLGLVLFFLSCGGSDNQNEDRSNSKPIKEEKKPDNKAEKNIIFFGNSLTAGYGVEEGEAFPALTQKRLDSLSYAYNVINAGVSGETTASGLSRVDWVVKRQPVEIFVLELGGNDGLRGIQPSETKRNLKAIIEKVREIHPEVKILLAGMMVAPNMGPDYAKSFQKVFPEVSKEKEVNLIPFLLKDVGGEEDLNQPDGIHPTPEGHKIVAETVWKHLKPLLIKEKP